MAKVGEDANKSKFAPMERPEASPAPTVNPPSAAAKVQYTSLNTPLSAPTPAPLSKRPSLGGTKRITTTVLKGPHGIGLDISKAPDGRTIVQRFKDLPDGAENPAMKCNPAIQPGDIIAEVNDVVCPNFMDAVKLIKSSSDKVKLTLERA